MRRIIFIVLSLGLLIYIIETTEILGLCQYKPNLSVSNTSNEYILEWNRLPYWAFYEVEVLNTPPEHDRQHSSSSQRISLYRTFSNAISIDHDYPFRTYWRVSAQGLFSRPLGAYSEPINLSQLSGDSATDFFSLKPQPTVFFSSNNPAPETATLTWTVVPGAAYYEFELLQAEPENPNGIQLSQQSLATSREVFTNGHILDLSSYKLNRFFWRVRALDYDGNPMGVFSDATELYVNHAYRPPQKPTVNCIFNRDGMPTPLYPVYSWIPIVGASSYEVEILNSLPEYPNTTQPSRNRIWSKEVVGVNDCYDEQPRNIPGIYYWRVRGLDHAGQPVGVYSDAAPFVVDLSLGNYAATFGDSITHGGGAVSYSPADWEYDYQTYLNFTAVNLGKSGDTSETLAERFENDVLPYKPKFLLIMGGTNSLRGGVAATQVIKDFIKIREKCNANSIRPIFLTLPPINPNFINKVFGEETAPNWREQFDIVNSFIRQQRYFIDLEPYFLDSERSLPDHFAVDGLHLDIEGKRLIAQVINLNWSKVTR